MYGKKEKKDTLAHRSEHRSQSSWCMERRTLLDTGREQRSQRAPGVWKEEHSRKHIDNRVIERAADVYPASQWTERKTLV